MIIEYTLGPHDLVKRCYGCKHLKMEDEWRGKCVCTFNHVTKRRRYRDVTDRACVYKNCNEAAERGGV